MNAYTAMILQNSIVAALVVIGLFATESLWCLLGLFLMVKVEHKD